MGVGDDERARRLHASWQANAAAWTDAVRGRAIDTRRRVTDAAVLDAIARRAPARVLDLGCGEGWLVRALSGRGVRALGVDASPALIERARAGGGGHFRRTAYAEIAAGALDAEGPFDAVVANFALLEAEVVPLLEALRGPLAPGGGLIVQTVHPRAAGGDEAVDGWREEDFRGFPGEWCRMPWYFRTRASWIGALEAAGFRVLELREPADPDTGAVVSLLLVAEAARAEASR